MPRHNSGPRYQRVRVVDEMDIPESRGYLDTKEFLVYTALVKAAIDALYKRENRPVRVAEIKRQLGEDLIERQTWDALDALCGVGSIAMTNDVSPIRFAPQEIPEKRSIGYATGPAVPSDKTRPFNGSFKRERGETF